MSNSRSGNGMKENSHLLELGRPSYESNGDSDTDSKTELESSTLLGGYGKAIIFGGVDGILTSFTIITGTIGGGFSWDIILLIGLSNVIAAAVAMGANEYLSSKAHHDFVLTEKRREKWEYKNHKDAEVKEMVHLFVNRGMSHPDAELVVKKMAEYEDFFVDLIVSQELGQLSDDSELNFLQDGFIMFISFASFGILPLIPFVFGAYDLLPENNLAMISVCSTLSLLFFLGCIKSTFSTSSYWLTSGVESLLLGSVTAGVSYFIAMSLKEILL